MADDETVTISSVELAAVPEPMRGDFNALAMSNPLAAKHLAQAAMVDPIGAGFDPASIVLSASGVATAKQAVIDSAIGEALQRASMFGALGERDQILNTANQASDAIYGHRDKILRNVATVATAIIAEEDAAIANCDPTLCAEVRARIKSMDAAELTGYLSSIAAEQRPAMTLACTDVLREMKASPDFAAHSIAKHRTLRCAIEAATPIAVTQSRNALAALAGVRGFNV